MSTKFFSYFYMAVLILTVFVTVFFVPLFPNISITISNDEPEFIHIDNSEYSWPTPGYTYITSPFGPRKSPAPGASTYHNAIDIGAPEGAKVIACFSGKVTYTGFNGASGFTVIVESDNIKAYYSHVDPDFIVYENEYVEQNQVIAEIGPKNVYDVPNNPYKDSSGNPTNGATTGAHLHFAIKIDGEAIDPMSVL